MHTTSIFRVFRVGFLIAVLGAWLVGPVAMGVSTPGSVKLTATINDMTVSGTVHYAVAWVTKADGTFIKTLWKQGNANFTNSKWTVHCATWTAARGTSTVLDGFTSVTAADYTPTANNPVTATWNCLDASSVLVPDGNYIFKIQYAENGPEVDGPVTSALTWTKGPSASTVNPANQGTTTMASGNNFTAISIVWTPTAAVAPTITSAAPPSSGTMGTAYNFSCTATGTAPVSFSATNLPTGLSISSAGVISGTPGAAGTFSGTITASNGTLPDATQAFSITIAQAIVFTSAAPPGTGTVGTAYNHTCTAIGTAPLSFTLASGALPTSLVLSSAGVISGTPSVVGTFSGTIQASNGGLATPVTQGFSIVIGAAVAYTPGNVTLTATLHDLASGGDTRHFAVVWVTKTVGATNQFIKTLWKQGDGTSFADPNGVWADHFITYETARGSSTALDGYTSATAENYLTSITAPATRANNPVSVLWNCQDATNTLVADGSYKFWIQYSEDITNGVDGPVTTGLAWTKSTASDTQNPAAQGVTDAPVGGSNFTNMQIVWTPTATTAPLIAVEQPAGSGLTSGTSTINLGSSTVGTGVPLTFTLKNTGTASLTGIAVTRDGTNSADYTVTASPPATLAAAGSTTFTVTFNPSASGTRTAALHIASSDTTQNPFNIALTGTGTVVALPLIAVEQPLGSGLTSGTSTINFGSSTVGTGVPLTFTLKNTGTASLTGIAVTRDGTNSADYTVTASPPATLAAAGSTTFTVTFNPSASGTRIATLHIASNDTTQNQFNIALTGTGTSVGGTAPDIALEQPPRKTLASGETRRFPTVALRKKATLTFTVRNTLAAGDSGSAANLRITSVVLSGPNANEFHVSVNSIKSIKPGKYKTFKVQFAPRSEGNKEALLSIFSNDPDESPYLVRLLGSTPNSDDADKADPLATSAPLAAAPAMVQELAPSPAVVDALPQNSGTRNAYVHPSDGVDAAGLYQWLAYAFSGDPARAAEEDAMFRQVMATVDGQVYPALNFRRLKSTDMLTFVVEESTDMTHWQPVPIPWQLAGEIIDHGDGYEWLTVLASAPLTADAQIFMRLRVKIGP